MQTIDTMLAVRSIESSSIALRTGFQTRREWARTKLALATDEHKKTLASLLFIQPFYMLETLASIGFALASTEQAAKGGIFQNSPQWEKLSSTWEELQAQCMEEVQSGINGNPQCLSKAFSLFLACSSFALFFGEKASLPSDFLSKYPDLWKENKAPLHFENLNAMLGHKGA